MEAAEVERVQLRVPADLGRRIEALVRAPELGFDDLEHFLAAALHSFTSYKERQLRRLREDAAEGRISGVRPDPAIRRTIDRRGGP